MRSVLFCNEMLGLGHLRLSLAIADELARPGPEATALVVTGSPAAGMFRPGPRVDVMKLPTLPVGADSSWSATAHRPSSGLALSEQRVAALRSELALRTVVELRPDIAVVDYRPLGRNGDLRPALAWLRENGHSTIALGLWDIDDSQARLARFWTPELVAEVADLYDLALVYGPSIPGDVRIDALAGAGIPVHHTGLVCPALAARGPLDLEDGYLLVVGGGGVDAFGLLDAVLAALSLQPLDVPAILVAGPMMAEAQASSLRERASPLDVRVELFRADMGELLAGSQAVVAMAGYCTVAEVLASGKPALLVPRAYPREEQLNRARRWSEAGRVQLIEPAALDPARLREALDGLLAAEPGRPEVLTGAADAASILLQTRREA